MDLPRNWQPEIPKSPPPLEPDAPQWLVEVRDRFAATGWINSKRVVDNLRVREVLTTAFLTFTKQPDITVISRTPRDDSMMWTLRMAGREEK